MWTRTSLVLLTTLVVSGFSFPRSDHGEYKIPEVGSGPRSQYYVLHSDGTFKYGFDTGEGAFESVKSHTLGNRGGKFGYVDPDGNTIHLEYEAGEGGFVARGDHLPKPSPQLAQALATVANNVKPFIDPLSSGDSDASYGFQFQSDDHSRNEQSDSDGTVTGSYSYIDENGVTRSFTYRAGKGIGFVIEGDGLTQDDITPAKSHSASSWQAQSPPSPQRPTTTRQRHHQQSRLNTVSGQRSSSRVPGDTSYSFSYDAGDHSRSESSDANLNVDGTFSFVADDGNRRTVNYVAGSATGFQAQGDHLPVAPQPIHQTTSNQRSQHSRPRVQTGFRGQQANTAFTRSQTPGDASYSFAYDAGDHSRSEFSDANLNVDGTFSFVADDGNRRTVNYVAGSSTGFQAEGDHLPKVSDTDFGSKVSVPRQGQRHGGASPAHHQRRRPHAAHRHQSSTFGPSQTRRTQPSRTSSGHTSSTASQSQQSSATARRPFEEANVISSFSPSGAYSFSYDTSSHSRAESGDDDNNVVGNFAFTAPHDGIRRELNYEASSATGFIVEGDHIPVGPVVPGAPSGQPTGRIVPESSVPFVDPLASSDTDASYNFQFESDTYTRSESSDKDGNIVGSYTVVDDDGTRRTYSFKAGEGIGFETEEVSRTQGPKPARPVQTQTSQLHAGQIPSIPTFIPAPNAPSIQGLGTYLPPTRQHQTSQSFPTTHSHGFTSTQNQASHFSPTAHPQTSQSFNDYTLHRYDNTPGAEKFGYVLKFN